VQVSAASPHYVEILRFFILSGLPCFVWFERRKRERECVCVCERERDIAIKERTVTYSTFYVVRMLEL
jgi:recombinational DNA repair protein RecR